MRPRGTKVGQVGPKRGPKEPKVSPRWPKGEPRGAQDAPMRAQRVPKGIPRGQKDPRWTLKRRQERKHTCFKSVKKPFGFYSKSEHRGCVWSSEGFMLAHFERCWVHGGACWMNMGSPWIMLASSYIIFGVHGASWKALGVTVGASMEFRDRRIVEHPGGGVPGGVGRGKPFPLAGMFLDVFSPLNALLHILKDMGWRILKAPLQI